VANATVECPKCKIIHEFYLKFSNNPKIDSIFKKKGIRPFPIDNIVKCSCGHEIDLSGLKHELEIQMGEKAILNKGGNVKNGVKR
jgi:hypothetical protein